MDGSTYVLVIILLAILFFILFRAVTLWYFKIDKIVKVLEEIRDGNKSNTSV